MSTEACLPQDPTMWAIKANNFISLTLVALVEILCQRLASSQAWLPYIEAFASPLLLCGKSAWRLLHRRGPRAQPTAAGRRPHHPGATAGGRRRRQLQVSGWCDRPDATQAGHYWQGIVSIFGNIMSLV